MDTALFKNYLFSHSGMYAGKTLDTLQICPTFERFEFMNWSEEGEVRH